MPTTVPPVRYDDPEYQKAHNDLFLAVAAGAPEAVLPPGVSQEHFEKAIGEFVNALGENAVFTREALRDYLDPYEIRQPDVERKIPSAAVWSVILDDGSCICAKLGTVPQISRISNQSSQLPTDTVYHFGPSREARTLVMEAQHHDFLVVWH